MSYFIIQICYFLLTFICLAAVLWGLTAALSHAEMTPKRRKKLVLWVGGLLCLWVFIVAAAALSGFTQNFEAFPPRLLLFLLPPLIALIFLLRSKQVSHLLQQIPPQSLLFLQFFRVPVELLLWQQFLLGLTPIQMTLEGLNLDIVSGILGPLAGLLYMYGGKARWKYWLLNMYNFLGLALLINIVAIAILSFPTPFRVFLNEPANTLITYFPVIFLPTILVPLAYYLHAFSIKQLYLEQKKLRKEKNVLAAA